MIEIHHPDLGEDRIQEAPESSLHVLARQGWKRVDGKPIVDPRDDDPDFVEPHPELVAAEAATDPSVDLQAALDAAIAEHGDDSDEAQAALAAITAAEATTEPSEED
jgi:hypothetical protein